MNPFTKTGKGWTYLQLCTDAWFSLEDLPGVMDDRDEWRERVREICTSSTTFPLNVPIKKPSRYKINSFIGSTLTPCYSPLKPINCYKMSFLHSSASHVILLLFQHLKIEISSLEIFKSARFTILLYSILILICFQQGDCLFQSMEAKLAQLQTFNEIWIFFARNIINSEICDKQQNSQFSSYIVTIRQDIDKKM